ncbi:MAG TPA: DUF2807 domain-containing protein [Steroidobacteraceae bacterium]|jgi:hypothetical protein|nr:DUF2807 domain-containing protein [Steroidobacteraceae bacterium]
MKSTHRLVLVAVSGALLSAGCFSGAYQMATANDSKSTEIISREIPWDGSTSLSLGVRSVVRYTQAPGPGKVIAQGPHRSVSTLLVSGGEIRDELLHTGATLDITVIAPNVSQFYVNGESRLSIEAYDQPNLSLTTQGGATIDAAGRTDSVTIAMQGSGVVNLARFQAHSASADIGGTSTLVAAPAQSANLRVRNYASAVLLTRPENLVVKLTDSGRVVDARSP